MPVLDICKFNENAFNARTIFSHYMSMGPFGCRGNQILNRSAQKPNSKIPTPMMVPVKFDQDWPTGFGDILVQIVDGRTTKPFHTISSPSSAQMS